MFMNIGVSILGIAGCVNIILNYNKMFDITNTVMLVCNVTIAAAVILILIAGLALTPCAIPAYKWLIGKNPNFDV